MKKRFLFTFLALSIFTFCLSAFAVDTDSVQVFYNAKVYTGEANTEETTAFVVKNGKFIYVGNDNGALKYGEGRDLKGKRIIPGLFESHAHPMCLSSISAFKGYYKLKNIYDPKKAIQELKIANKKGKFKDADKIFIHGAIPNPFMSLTAKDLDAIFPDKPVVIYAGDGHSLWMNTAFMKAMNINKSTKDYIPGASYFKRDSEGNPTGFFAEPIVMLYKITDYYGIDKEKIYKELKDLNHTYNSLGYTGIADAGFFLLSNEDGLKILKKMEDNNELTMHYYPTYYWGGPSDKPISTVEKEMINLRKNYTTSLIKPDTLKMFADGVIETRTAFLRDNYPNTNTKGSEISTTDDILMGAKMAKKNDFNIHIHAIGDGAIENTLNAYKMVGPMSGIKTTAHSQVVPIDVLKKYYEQKDVIYQTTPNWVADTKSGLSNILGYDRYSQQMPIGRIMKNGNIATFGSDSIGPPFLWDAFLNIYIGIKRGENNINFTFPGTNDGITVEQGLQGYTINGAKQVREENNIGSIKVGKSADFVILNKDVINIPTEKIMSVKVIETWFRGKNVYKK